MEHHTPSMPNEFKVVELTNPNDFDFTPELGCMFDGKPFFVAKGGGKLRCAYPLGKHLAINLAKQMFIRNAPAKDIDSNNGLGRVLWNDQTLLAQANALLKDLYEDEKEAAPLNADQRLVAKTQALNRPVPGATEEVPGGYKDKAEVIAELTKRNIKFDARKSKADLEKLLTTQSEGNAAFDQAINTSDAPKGEE